MIGYVLLFQGLNYIAGLMLLIVRKQEVAFWLLDVIVGKLLPGIIFIKCSITGKKILVLQRKKTVFTCDSTPRCHPKHPANNSVGQIKRVKTL